MTEKATGQAVQSGELLAIGDEVRLLVHVDGLGEPGEVGDIIGVHPGCSKATYTVRLDSLRRSGCAPQEIELANAPAGGKEEG